MERMNERMAEEDSVSREVPNILKVGGPHGRANRDEKIRLLQAFGSPRAEGHAAGPELEFGPGLETNRADSFHLPEFDGQVHCLRKFFERAAFLSLPRNSPRHLRDIAALRAKTCLNYAPMIAISKGERVHCHRVSV